MKNNKKLEMTGRAKLNIITGCIIALFYVLLQNFAAVKVFLGGVYSLISPFVGGLVLAYILNLILNGLEKYILKPIKNIKVRRAFSVPLSAILLIAIVSGLLFLMIPRLAQSVLSIVTKAHEFLSSSEDEVRAFAETFKYGDVVLAALYGQWDSALDIIQEWALTLLPDVVNTTISFGSGVVKAVIAFFVAIYVLFDKERLLRRTSLIFRALLPEKTYNFVMHALDRSNRTFSNFISGKLLDSLIIGIICFIGMLILKLPNPTLIAVIVGVTNIIPTFGPFIGAIPSAIIIFIESPIQAVYFAIFILLLQQFDGNILGPKILGNSTGISALWVLISITFFGSLWGVAGMIVGVPLVAVVTAFVEEYITARLKQKGYDHSNNKIGSPGENGEAPPDEEPAEEIFAEEKPSEETPSEEVRQETDK